MNIITRIKQSVRLSLSLVGVTLAVAGIAIFAANGIYADVALGGGQNCDANAVVYCGATSASQLASKYSGGDSRNSAASIQDIFSYFGITSADMQSISTTAVAGTVTKSGDVFVGNQLVAHGALTAGRQSMAGSTAVTSGGTTFYTRPPSVSFLSNSLNAYVVMANGQFKFAILSSCGNPVKASPTTTPPPPPAPAPAAQCTNLTLTQDQTDTRKVTATVTYSVQNGATFTGASFNWGDNTSTPPNPATTAEHQYSQDGTHTVIATLTFTGVAATPPVTCQAAITTSSVMPACTELDINQNNDTVTVTNFSSTNNNGAATLNKVTLNWGDGSQVAESTTATGIINQSHTYGSISSTQPPVVTATAFYQVNGQSQPFTSPSCQKTVTVPQTPPPPVTTTTPPPAAPTPTAAQPVTVSVAPKPVSTLVNTGPGSTAALFLVVSGVGVLAYRWFLIRRLAN